MNEQLLIRPAALRTFSVRKLLPNLALAVVSLGMALVLGEVALRAIMPPKAPRPFEFRIPHPVLGWVLQPNASYQLTLPDGPVAVTYNSQGWRDVEHTIAKPEGVFRILVLGDSFMEANTVELGQTFPRRIEALTGARGLNTEVINLGVGGYGTLQEYLVFRDIGYQYAPDLVILAFYPSNDLANNSMALASILTAADTRPFLDPSDATGWTITPVDFERAQNSYSAYQSELEAKRNSWRLLQLAEAGFERLRRVQSALSASGGEPSAASEDSYRQEMALLGVHYCAEPPEYTEAWNTTERILARLNTDIEAAGSTLVVVSVPAIETVSLEYAGLVRANAAHPEMLCLEDAPAYARLNGILAKLGIEHIDLLPDFRSVARGEGIQLFQLLEGMHWTPAGHELAAERVVAELFERQVLSTR